MLKDKFEIMRIEIPPPKRFIQWDFFHDDGYVASLYEHENKLRREYEYPLRDYSERFQKCGGLTKQFKKEVIYNGGILVENHYHIFYRKLTSPVLDISFRAHEETHVIQKMRLQETLFKEISKGMRRDFCFDDLCRRFKPWESYFGELISCIGESFALHMRGIQLGEILDDSIISDDLLKDCAKEGYQWLKEGDLSSIDRLYDLVLKRWGSL